MSRREKRKGGKRRRHERELDQCLARGKRTRGNKEVEEVEEISPLCDDGETAPVSPPHGRTELLHVCIRQRDGKRYFVAKEIFKDVLGMKGYRTTTNAVPEEGKFYRKVGSGNRKLCISESALDSLFHKNHAEGRHELISYLNKYYGTEFHSCDKSSDQSVTNKTVIETLVSNTLGSMKEKIEECSKTIDGLDQQEPTAESSYKANNAGVAIEEKMEKFRIEIFNMIEGIKQKLDDYDKSLSAFYVTSLELCAKAYEAGRKSALKEMEK